MSEGSPQDAEGLAARAREFATEAHARIDHRRKYTGQPYQEHLKAVAELVSPDGHPNSPTRGHLKLPHLIERR